MRRFDKLHPAVVFFYFLAVLLTSMFSMNPVLVLIGYFFSVLFAVTVSGVRAMLKSLAYSIPMAVMIALLNPIFVHKGVTVLFYLNNNPVTKEAVLYGVFASLTLMSVFYWCRSYSEIMTNDKTLYLFGRVLPKVGLILSMAMAFVPKFTAKFREIHEAQKALGIYAGKSYVDKVRSFLRVFSILVTSCLENSVDTADSMRARGYGMGRRSYYSDFRFSGSDLAFLLVSAVLGISAPALAIGGAASFSYYPTLSPLFASAKEFVLYAVWIFLCGMSACMEIKETILWRYLRSRI